MCDERAHLILNMLRAIRAEQSAQREKLDEIINRLGVLEREVALKVPKAQTLNSPQRIERFNDVALGRDYEKLAAAGVSFSTIWLNSE